MFLVANYFRKKGTVRGMSVTPQKLWSKKKRNVAYMKSSGCKVYCPIDKKDRGGKLEVVRCGTWGYLWAMLRIAPW